MDIKNRPYYKQRKKNGDDPLPIGEDEILLASSL